MFTLFQVTIFVAIATLSPSSTFYSVYARAAAACPLFQRVRPAVHNSSPPVSCRAVLFNKESLEKQHRLLQIFLHSNVK